MDAARVRRLVALWFLAHPDVHRAWPSLSAAERAHVLGLMDADLAPLGLYSVAAS
jgi:hypothetical protein